MNVALWLLAFLAPTLLEWWSQPTALARSPAPVSDWLRWALTIMAAGVFLSGVRDMYAAFGMPHGGWPWTLDEPSTEV